MTIRSPFSPQPDTAYNPGHFSWFFPALYFLVCVAVLEATGLFSDLYVSEHRLQRDINAAIGLPLLTAYFWLTVRLINKQLASTILGVLLKKNTLAQFARHRRYLAGRFRQHIIQCAVISLSLTTLYIVSEDLLAAGQPLHVFVLDIVAYPYWFFFWLFLYQSVSGTRYVTRRLIGGRPDNLKDIDDLKVVADFGLTNCSYAMVGVSLLPVFWMNTTVPPIDLLILSLFLGILFTYLFIPVVKVHRLIKHMKQRHLSRIDTQISACLREGKDKGKTLEAIELLESEREIIESVSVWPVRPEQVKRLAGTTALVPTSWLILWAVETMTF